MSGPKTARRSVNASAELSNRARMTLHNEYLRLLLVSQMKNNLVAIIGKTPAFHHSLMQVDRSGQFGMKVIVAW